MEIIYPGDHALKQNPIWKFVHNLFDCYCNSEDYHSDDLYDFEMDETVCSIGQDLDHDIELQWNHKNS